MSLAAVDAEWDQFLAWLHDGQRRGWVSAQYCARHETAPIDEGEEQDIDDGWDPCIPCVRIWGPPLDD